jgi:hypothetical protein
MEENTILVPMGGHPLFVMSMYANKETLYKAKADYYMDYADQLEQQIRGAVPDEQSKLESKIEIVANYVSGFLIAWVTITWVITPLVTVGFLTWDDGFAITMVFTVVSILRSYYWRRFFAKNLHKVVHKFVKGIFV